MIPAELRYSLPIFRVYANILLLPFVQNYLKCVTVPSLGFIDYYTITCLYFCNLTRSFRAIELNVDAQLIAIIMSLTPGMPMNVYLINTMYTLLWSINR